jgi:hypothetical protein
MTPQQWIAFGFAALLIVFLIIAYFVGQRLEPQQWQILRFLCALTAAFAGWFISGAVVVEYAQELAGGGRLTAQGSAGMGLFLLVWFGFKTVSHPPPDLSFSVPAGWTLEQAATALAEHDASKVDLRALNNSERSAPLEAAELRTRTVLKALQTLGNLAKTTAIRPYTVTYDPPIYTFRT